jgi:hypothetical protein
MSRVLLASAALALGAAVGYTARPAVPPSTPQAFEVGRPGAGPHPVKLVPVAEDTGEEFRAIAPADPRAEFWRVTVHSDGRERTFLAQPAVTN